MTRHITASKTVLARAFLGGTFALASVCVSPSGAEAAPLRSTVSPISAKLPARHEVGFQPHRAVYDISLSRVDDESDISSMNGRMVYDFAGNPCDGYSITFRFVTNVEDSSGSVQMTDLRTSSYENLPSGDYQFLTEIYVNQDLTEETKGTAERKPGGLLVSLTNPETRSVRIGGRILLPTEHLQAVVAAARQGKHFLVADVYDGSEDGDEAYSTTTVIGEAQTGAEVLQGDTAEAVTKIGTRVRWPVTVSYFEQNGEQEGEQTPSYQMSFLLYENGVSRRLRMDYGNFELQGSLRQIEVPKPVASSKARPAAGCKVLH